MLSLPRGGCYIEWLFVEASNCGGVAVSGLEMSQNSQRITWSPQEVDARLKDIMVNCYQVRFVITNLFISTLILTYAPKICLSAGEKWGSEASSAKDTLPSLVTGANVAGFIKVADAMKAQGDWW